MNKWFLKIFSTSNEDNTDKMNNVSAQVEVTSNSIISFLGGRKNILEINTDKKNYLNFKLNDPELANHKAIVEIGALSAINIGEGRFSIVIDKTIQDCSTSDLSDSIKSIIKL